MRRLQILAAAIAGGLLVAAGCGGALTGTYADDAGITSYEFAPDGRVRVSVLGTTVEARYRLDGEQVLVTSPQGTVVLTRGDGQLYGPMGLVLLRQRE